MWAIASGNFLHSRNIATALWFQITAAVVIIIAVFWVVLIYSNTEAAAVTALLLIVAAFYALLVRRNREITEIISVIRNIRTNKVQDKSGFSLNRDLRELQDEIVLMYDKIQNDIEILKKLEKARSEFLGNVSHELKTPLFAIQGYLETLLNGALFDEKVNKHFLEKAHQHGNSLSTLLNDLVEISLIEAGEMRMSFRYFNINEYLIQNFIEYKDIAAKKELDFSLQLPEKDFQVYGDKNRLKQVLHNLIQNAIKYTERGSVVISVEELPKAGVISVKDTGVGIGKEDITRIFERFYRVDKARSRDVGGTGLGLAIVKHIIEAHGSKIEVASEPGSGSVFSFKLKK